MWMRSALLFVCVLLPVCALAGTGAAGVQSPGDGEVHVYLQPLQPGTTPPVIALASLSVTRDTGAEVPLSLALPAITPAAASRQRRLASGRVPAGSYTRLSIALGAPARPPADAMSAAPANPPLQVDAPFEVSRGGAVMLWLTLQAATASAAPRFTARVAPRPIAGRSGFVSNVGSHTITMFDKRLREAAAVIPTAAGPSGMALDQRLGRLYVACAEGDEVQAIDVNAAQVVDRERLAAGDGPRELALTPDGRTLLSVNTGSNTVAFFEAASLARLERVAVGSGPSSVAIDPTGRRAFVFNTLSDSISVVDVARRAVVTTISTDASPVRGEFGGRGDRLYVVHARSPYVTVLDATQSTVITRARLRIGLGAIEADTRRGVLYIGGRDDTMVEVYDPNTLLPIGSMKTPSGVSHLAIDSDQNALYMVSPDTGTVVVGGLSERRVVTEIDVGEGPYWVAVMGER